MKDEMDILREVSSTSAAQASRAVSELLGRKITLELPSVESVSYDQLPSRSGIRHMGVAVFSRLLSGLQGEIALVLDEKDAFKLLSLSFRLKDEEKNAGIFTECGLSLLKEVGNIAICAYTMTLSIILKRQIITSIPTLMNGSVDTILTAIFRLDGPREAFLIEAAFTEAETNITGRFCLVLTHQAAADIKRTCKQILADLENK